MQLSGDLKKMRTYANERVQYQLPIGDELIDMNALIGKTLSIQFMDAIHCIHCGRKTTKSFNQGHCFPCFRSLAACDSCIMKPEQCHYRLGTCREPEWGKTHCMRPHIVYLANSSGPKVGITRSTPDRWMDQGAIQAMPIFQVASRYHSGLLEVILKEHISDRTQWKRMLSDTAPIDLVQEKMSLLSKASDAIDALCSTVDDIVFLDAPVQTFTYPVDAYPEKKAAINLLKNPSYSGRLLGIKGQYLLFETAVFNVRKHAGYAVTLDAD